MPILRVVLDDGLMAQEPLAVLQRRMYKKGSSARVQLPIEWKNGSVEDATWEDYDEFLAKFPDFSL